MALAAGVDAELPSTSAYGAPLLAALGDGRASEAALDAAVERVLRLKLRLGAVRAAVRGPAGRRRRWRRSRRTRRRSALELARRSLVLAENDGILPLAPGLARIAVVGPLADSARDLIGDYGHLLHLETLNEGRLRKDTFGFPLTDALPLPDLAGNPTILSGLLRGSATSGSSTPPGAGSGTRPTRTSTPPSPRPPGRDVAIVVLGERSGLTDDATTGEFRDRSSLGFMGRQQELLERVVATGTPVVLVVVSGRPLALAWAAEHCAAILLAWVPGDAGPEAVAAVLAGDAEPGRQAAGVVPAVGGPGAGDLPASPHGRAVQPQGPVRGLADHPAVAVRVRAVVHHLRAGEPRRRSRAGPDRRRGRRRSRVEVTNTGTRRGDEVVQLYVRDLEASVARPVLELRGFRRVTLEAGECRRVRFELSAEQLAFTAIDYRRVVEPGDVAIQVGTSSADLALATTITLAGPVVEVPVRTRFVTPSSVE